MKLVRGAVRSVGEYSQTGFRVSDPQSPRFTVN